MISYTPRLLRGIQFLSPALFFSYSAIKPFLKLRQIIRRCRPLRLSQLHLSVNIEGNAGRDARRFLHLHLLLVCLRSIVMFCYLALDFGGDQSIENIQVLLKHPLIQGLLVDVEGKR